MNRIIAMLILGVLLTAMVLIVANYMSRPDMPENYVQEAPVPSQAIPAPQEEAKPEESDLRSMLQKPVPAPQEAPEAVDGGLPQPEPVAPGAGQDSTQQNASVPVPPVVTQPVPEMGKQPEKQPEPVQMPVEKAPEEVAAKNAEAEKPVAPPVSKPAPEAGKKVQKPATSGVLVMEAAGFRFDGSKLIFYVKGSNSFTHKMFTLAKPDRLVVDVKGAWKGVKTPATPSNRIVKATRSGVYKEYVRFVLDLKTPLSSYSAKMQGNELVIIMN
ncbi:AMIN domain-containing protein [Oleidesulfovibrio sp.]|uniref:AMIN domain-containing protein n=1 Tax=Oleidesulfovibrio sp. TaxID=2909707 RepID=UPI003A8BBCCC